jgi:poly(A) polymerase
MNDDDKPVPGANQGQETSAREKASSEAPKRRSRRPPKPGKETRDDAQASFEAEAAALLPVTAALSREVEAVEPPKRSKRKRPEAVAEVEAEAAPEEVVDFRFANGPKPQIHARAFSEDRLDDDAIRVLRRLHRNGFQAYLVGGVVRDLLLDRRPKDFDIATNARPHDIKAIFRNCRVIGRRFRLAHILFGPGKIIETATFRRDPTAQEFDLDDQSEEPLTPRAKSREDDADLLIRHDNVFGDPHEDALRRDFRLNGLFYDIERQEVIDFVGGMRDVEARVVSTIGLPDVRFREDPVRILRAIKFSARCDLGIDPECYDAMVAQREELQKAAKARLFEEVLRLLRGGAAHRSFWLAWETGVLGVLMPQVSAMLDDQAPRMEDFWRKLDAIDAMVQEGRTPSDTVLLSVVLTGAIDEALEGAKDPLAAYEDLLIGINELLALPRRIKERMRVVIGCQRRIRGGKIGTLVQRDFWPDAVELYMVECRARGVEPAAAVLATAHRPRPENEHGEHAVQGFDHGEGGEFGSRRRKRRRH